MLAVFQGSVCMVAALVVLHDIWQKPKKHRIGARRTGIAGGIVLLAAAVVGYCNISSIAWMLCLATGFHVLLAATVLDNLPTRPPRSLQ